MGYGRECHLCPSAGWQVTLCDPLWHVNSRSGEACCELLYSVYLYLYPPPPLGHSHKSTIRPGRRLLSGMTRCAVTWLPEVSTTLNRMNASSLNITCTHRRRPSTVDRTTRLQSLYMLAYAQRTRADTTTTTRTTTTTTTPVKRTIFKDSRYQERKTSLDLNDARDNGVLRWQWHQLHLPEMVATGRIPAAVHTFVFTRNQITFLLTSVRSANVPQVILPWGCKL